MGRKKGSKNRKGSAVYSNGNLIVSAIKSLKPLKCENYSKCGVIEMVDNNATGVICHMCVSDMVGVDPKLLLQKRATASKEETFPRGWHLYKQYVHTDGRVFEYGKENTSLNGKLKHTEIKQDVLTRSQRRRIREDKKLKREAKLAKRHKQIQKMKKHN